MPVFIPNFFSSLAPAESEGIREDLLYLMYRQHIRATVSMSAVVVMIALLLNRTQPINSILWFVCPVLIYKSIHMILFTMVKKNSRIALERKLFYVCLLGLTYGLCMASCLVFFNHLPSIDRAILSMILFTVSASYIGACAGYQPLYWAFVSPIVVPLVVMWFANVNSDVDSTLSASIGSLSLLLIGVLAAIGNNTFRFFSGSMKSIKEKDELAADLKHALDDGEQCKLRAEASNQSKTRLLAAVSHDLRQPVHVLNLFGAALKQTELNEESKHIVHDMNQAINDLSRQINVLLDITKLDEISYEPTLNKIPLAKIIDQVAQAYQAEITNKGLGLTLEYDSDVWVLSDHQLLTQILRNLVGNAIKYTNEGQITLTVKADSNNDEIILSVQDTGIGIAKNELAAVFEEYYQVNNPERNQENGLGLGLSIVKRTAEVLNHTIDAQSIDGEGSTFTLRMKRENAPRNVAVKALDSNAQAGQTAQTAQNFPTVSTQKNVKRIHVIDDDLLVCKAMRIALGSLGCDVSTTQSTEQTSEYFSDNPSPDIFIIDIRLQGDDSGFLTHKYIEKFHPNAKCVFVSGESDLFKEQRVNDGVDILQKPLTSDNLSQILESA